LIAIGLLCTSINLEINGLGILLPTSLGYALIAIGSHDMRDRSGVFAYVVVVAIILAIAALPLLVHGVIARDIWEVFSTWVGPPSLFMEVLLWLLVASGIYLGAVRSKQNGIRNAAGLAFPIILGAIIAWSFYPVKDNASKIASFVVYQIPSFYLVVVAGFAGRTDVKW
jgi:hypothetical protein